MLGPHWENEMKVFIVGKLQCISSDGSVRLLLYALYKKEKDAKKFIQSFINRYYKTRPYLCQLRCIAKDV